MINTKELGRLEAEGARARAGRRSAHGEAHSIFGCSPKARTPVLLPRDLEFLAAAAPMDVNRAIGTVEGVEQLTEVRTEDLKLRHSSSFRSMSIFPNLNQGPPPLPPREEAKEPLIASPDHHETKKEKKEKKSKEKGEEKEKDKEGHALWGDYPKKKVGFLKLSGGGGILVGGAVAGGVCLVVRLLSTPVVKGEPFMNLGSASSWPWPSR